METQRLHRAPLDAQTTPFARAWVRMHTVIGGVQTLGMVQHVERLQEQTTAFATIAYSVHALLPVRHGVNQPGVGGLVQDLVGLLARDLAAQFLLVYVTVQK